MSLVVLGSSGFIGSEILRNAKASFGSAACRGYSRSDFDLTTAGSLETLLGFWNSNTTLVVCSGIKRQFGDSLEIFEQNMRITLNLCQAIAENKPKRLIYFSSAAVYGEEINDLFINEETRISPQSLYGVGKFSTERLLERTAKDAGIPLVILRPTLVYGVGDGSKGYGPAGFYESILKQNEVLLWGDGSELREFLYVKDLARITVQLVNHDFVGILNPASGFSCSYRECAEIMIKQIDSRAYISEKPRSRPKVDNSYHSSLFHSLFPNFQFTSLEVGLGEMIHEQQMLDIS